MSVSRSNPSLLSRSTPVRTHAPVGATTEIEALTGLADLVLALGRVERITSHPDGVTRESDTDHSLMLVIVGCAFAARHFPDLDLGAVAQFAAVHDLVEAVDGVGDTPTLVITAEEHAAKTAREAAGWETLRRRYGAAFPWLAATIDAYLRQDSAEARFVWGLDKELPKLTHLLNGCTTHRTLSMTADQVEARYRERLAEMSPTSPIFPPCWRCATSWSPRSATRRGTTDAHEERSWPS